MHHSTRVSYSTTGTRQSDYHLRIYSHWVPGMRRVTTAVLDSGKNANNLQMQTENEERQNLGKPEVIDFIGGAEGDRTPDLLTASSVRAL